MKIGMVYFCVKFLALLSLIFQTGLIESKYYILSIVEFCFLAGILFSAKGRLANALFLFVNLLYSLQIISIVKSGSLLGVLAVENFDQVRSVSFGFKEIGLFIFDVLWFAFFSRRLDLSVFVPIKKYGKPIVLVSLFFFLWAGSKSSYLNSGRISSYDLPFSSFVAEVFRVVKSKYDVVVCSRADRPQMKKSIIFNNQVNGLSDYNYIVIFVEGFSRDLIDYKVGNDFLMPNVKKFSTEWAGISADNYFNHTAATYRGVTGQLSSSYPEYDFNGFSNLQKSFSELERNKNQSTSLVDVARQGGFLSYFYSTHNNSNPMNKAWQLMGFDGFYARDDANKNRGVCLENDVLSSRDAFQGLKYVISHVSNKGKYFLSTYLESTHAFVGAGNCGGSRYNNQVLDRFSYFDDEFGRFLSWFKESGLDKNTVLIVTSDHATYPDPEYKKLFSGSDYFVNKIPLLIYVPNLGKKIHLDMNGRNSLALLPTVATLMGVREFKNNFLGYSIFDSADGEYNYISAIGHEFYSTKNSIVVPIKNSVAMESYYKENKVCGLTGW